jgi:hypothetical protein
MSLRLSPRIDGARRQSIRGPVNRCLLIRLGTQVRPDDAIRIFSALLDADAFSPGRRGRWGRPMADKQASLERPGPVSAPANSSVALFTPLSDKTEAAYRRTDCLTAGRGWWIPGQSSRRRSRGGCGADSCLTRSCHGPRPTNRKSGSRTPSTRTRTTCTRSGEPPSATYHSSRSFEEPLKATVIQNPGTSPPR